MHVLGIFPARIFRTSCVLPLTPIQEASGTIHPSRWLQSVFIAKLLCLSRRKVVCMNIYIGNLSENTTDDTLKSLFAEFGVVESVKVIRDRFSGRSKGFGFLEMPSNSEADQAIKALNGNRIDGNNIKVRPADSGGKKRKKRPFHRRGF